MAKRSLDKELLLAKRCKMSSAMEDKIDIDHTRLPDHSYHQSLLKECLDSKTDITFIVDKVEIPAHKEVIEILKSKRQLVRDAIERDKRIAETEKTEVAHIFQMTGTTEMAFKKLLNYIYNGRVVCDLVTAIELAKTALKLKFHPLVASLAQHLNLFTDDCLNFDTVDDLYHISLNCQNEDLLKSCRKFMDENASDLNKLFIRRDIQSTDPLNVFVLSLDKSRYNNYIHFLLPENLDICFNLSVSSDRINWTLILNNDEIWSKFWNWVYFHERRIKFIRFEFKEQKGEQHFDPRLHFSDKHFLCKRANIDLEFDRETGHLIPKHDVIKYPIRNTKHVFDPKTDLFTYCMSFASAIDKKRYYYYHNIGDKAFLEFYLSQTCLIDNFRFRLWDFDQRTYDFKVEIKSEEEEDYTVVNEDKNQSIFRSKHSWLTIQLRGRRAVRWIRITGVKGPHNDTEFAIVDFECPGQQQSGTNQKKKF